MNRITFTQEEANGIKNIIGWLEQTNFFKYKNKNKQKATQFFTNAKNGLESDSSMTSYEWDFIKNAYTPNKAAFDAFILEKIDRLQKQQESINSYTQMIGEMSTGTGRLLARVRTP